MKLTWYGTASIKFETEHTNFITDPFVPLTGSKVPIKITDFDNCQNILVSHGHFDHIMNIPEIVYRNPNTKVFCSKTPAASLRREGVPAKNIQIIKPGDTISLGDITIEVFKGRHSNLEIHSLKTLLKPSNYIGLTNLPIIYRLNRKFPENGETLFFNLKHQGKTISILGSLCLDPAINYPTNSDLLIMPYSGKRNNFIWAKAIMDELNPKQAMLYHFDVTYPPLFMPVDLQPFIDYYRDRCIIPSHGRTMTFPFLDN